MDDILYLVHAVSKYDNSKPYVNLRPSRLTDSDEQFPGVFFTLITKQNRHREPLYEDDNVLIFSKKLLLQHNFHININDYNGFINEKNTYLSWQLDAAVKKIAEMPVNEKLYVGNEVVFHDPIPMKYLCLYIQKYNISKELTPKTLFTKETSLFLPNNEIYNDEEPDMTKIPFYCIPNENNYTGTGKNSISSRNFYEKMAEMCNIKVSKTDSIDDIINKIKENIDYLYNKREILNIDIFKKFTISLRK